MRRNQLFLLIILIIIFIVIGASTLFFSNHKKEIEVKILDIYHQNNQYFLNVSIENNQETIGWIDDIYLSTLQGSEIDLTGAGPGYKIAPGEKKILTLWSPEVQISLTDPPFTFSYMVFPIGKQYRIYI